MQGHLFLVRIYVCSMYLVLATQNKSHYLSSRLTQLVTLKEDCW